MVSIIMKSKTRPIKNVKVLTKSGKDETKQNFNMILEAIEECLRNVLGESVAHVILSHFGRIGEVPHHQKIMMFSETLDLLGSGGQVLQGIILQNIHTKMGVVFEVRKGYSFSDNIEYALAQMRKLKDQS